MDPALTDAFEAQRPRLSRLAYRMLGSVAEADDVVQQEDRALQGRQALQGQQEGH